MRKTKQSPVRKAASKKAVPARQGATAGLLTNEQKDQCKQISSSVMGNTRQRPSVKHGLEFAIKRTFDNL